MAITATISGGILTLTGTAAMPWINRVSVTSLPSSLVIVDNDSAGTVVPVAGSPSAVRHINVSGVTGAGVYVFSGFEGDNRVIGSAQRDYIYAYGNGRDTVNGGAGDDSLYGNGGNDRLLGATGNDAADGGEGNDQFTGGKGNDTFDGGLGEDTMIFAGNRVDYDISIIGGRWQIVHARGSHTDGTDSFANVEFLQFADQRIAISSPPTNLTATISGGLLTVSGAAIVGSETSRVQVTSTATLLTIEDADSIGTLIPVSGSPSAVQHVDVSGVTGADVYVYSGFVESNRVIGSAGSDYIFAFGNGRDTLNGGAGDDFLFANRGNDRLIGGTGNDNADGGEGNDQFIGGKGNDTFDGGLGEDTMIFVGNRADYDLSVVGGGWQIVHARGTHANGTDSFANAEFLQFADQSVPDSDWLL